MTDIDFFREEELHPDLQPYLRRGRDGWFELHHPLVQALEVVPNRAAVVNRQFEMQSAEVRCAEECGYWSRYVHLHQRFYKFTALRHIAGKIGCDKEYWNFIADEWRMGRVCIYQNRAGWQKLWNSSRPCKHHAMDIKEREALAQLPAQLKVWRGIKHGKGRNGMSWTLDRNMAMLFARFRGGSTLLTARANKADVHALFSGQQEVVINKFEITAKEKVHWRVLQAL